MASLSFAMVGLLALVGTPIFVIFSLLALFSFYYADTDVSVVAIEMVRLASHPTLLAIPVFTFAGYLMAESKTPDRLLKFAQASFSWLPGGIAIICLIVCALFTAFTGGSGVTIIALGGLLYPILANQGYDDDFSLGLITASGSLGLLLPPSLPIILYGLVAKVDIDQLFVAGFVPCMVLIAFLSVYALYKGRHKKINNTPRHFSFSEFKTALWGARYELPIPFFVLGGIYGGYTTASETSVIVAFYVLLMNCFWYKDLNISQDIPRIAKDSMTLVGAILIILCCALGFVNYLIDEDVPLKILDFMKGHISSQVSFLICLNLFLLLVGMMLDIFTAIIVVVPIIVPIAREYNVDMIHLAVIFLTNLEIGYLTPPVGLNLFISSHRFDRPITEIYRASLPFLFILILSLIVITYVPSLTLFWFK